MHRWWRRWRRRCGGPSGGGSGGAGGVAGAGHVNTGSGSGGYAGRSAYNTTYVSGISESGGSSGNGYVNFRVHYTQPVDAPDGGGGGSGGVVSFNYRPNDGDSTAIAATIGFLVVRVVDMMKQPVEMVEVV